MQVLHIGTRYICAIVGRSLSNFFACLRIRLYFRWFLLQVQIKQKTWFMLDLPFFLFCIWLLAATVFRKQEELIVLLILGLGEVLLFCVIGLYEHFWSARFSLFFSRVLRNGMVLGLPKEFCGCMELTRSELVLL